jgi:protein-S-isoprenylcysteine O-methyltransferase Ste14
MELRVKYPNPISSFIGKFLYGLLFVVVVPGLLLLWAWKSEANIALPALQSSGWGYFTGLAGLILILWGMFDLVWYGKGLPMNAYPPENLVRKGLYRYLGHPIYAGFCLLVLGLALHQGSASGLWLIFPMTVLGVLALVWGYEQEALERRFGNHYQAPAIAFPAKRDEPLSVGHRLMVYPFLFVPFFLMQFMTQLTLGEAGAVDFLGLYPLDIYTEYFLTGLYIALHLAILAVPFLLRTQQQLRSFLIPAYAIAVAGLLTLVLFPVLGEAHFIALSTGSAENSFSFFFNRSVSFSVAWVFLLGRTGLSHFPRFRALWWVLMAILGLTTLLSSIDPLLHLFVGVAVYLLAHNLEDIWQAILNGSEKIANSWQEWQWGSVRVINHGIYIGIGAFVGTALMAWLTGGEYMLAMVLAITFSIIVSAVWAQLWEGSEKLKRPFGYYGGVVGGFLSIGIFYLMDVPIMLMMALFCIAMSWVQAIGRLRCLINGCCHGRESETGQGIQYFHPRSRVCGIANLKGVSLHPTPTYSILWLILVGTVELKLWFAGADYALIAGMYFLLTSLGRFVEEAYRGEVQTPIYRGLRLYQWIAIGVFVLGAVLTCIQTTPVALSPGFEFSTLWGALWVGFFTFFAMGVDFPKSNRRFSRLV